MYFSGMLCTCRWVNALMMCMQNSPAFFQYILFNTQKHPGTFDVQLDRYQGCNQLTCVLPLLAFAFIHSCFLVSHHFKCMLRPAEAPRALLMPHQITIPDFWIRIRFYEKCCAVSIFPFVFLVHNSSVHPAELFIKP